MQFRDLNTVLGLEIKVINDNEFSCRYCVVIKDKNELNINVAKVIEGTLPTILETLPKAYPVALTLTGKVVVHKNVVTNAEENLTELLQKAFPAIEEKDFYVQQFVQQEHALISLVRKGTADELITKLERSGLNIFVLSFGAIVSSTIWDQLNSYGTEILFDGHFFSLNTTNQWLSYQNNYPFKNEFQVKIGQEVIDERNIIAYATAFQLLLHQQLNLIYANAEGVNTRFLHFTQNHSLKQKALFCLIGLLVALLVSYIIFCYYNDKNTVLAQKLGDYTADTNQITLLLKNSSENEKLLKQLNWNGGYNYGFLLNEIGQSTPKELQLLEVSINEDKQTIIKINGITNNLTALNNWIFVLKQKPWIKTVRLLKYEEGAEAENYKFKLILTY